MTAEGFPSRTRRDKIDWAPRTRTEEETLLPPADGFMNALHTAVLFGSRDIWERKHHVE